MLEGCSKQNKGNRRDLSPSGLFVRHEFDDILILRRGGVRTGMEGLEGAGGLPVQIKQRSMAVPERFRIFLLRGGFQGCGSVLETERADGSGGAFQRVGL